MHIRLVVALIAEQERKVFALVAAEAVDVMYVKVV
jgi:hypothetical protein